MNAKELDIDFFHLVAQQPPPHLGWFNQAELSEDGGEIISIERHRLRVLTLAPVSLLPK